MVFRGPPSVSPPISAYFPRDRNPRRNVNMERVSITLLFILVVLATQRYANSQPIEQDPLVCFHSVSKSHFVKTFSLSTLSPNHSKSLALIAIFLAGDVQTNPGPKTSPVYPCGFCDRAVASCVDCVCCDECSVWYHRSCLEMCSDDFSLVQRNSVQWLCCKCESMNVDSFT